MDILNVLLVILFLIGAVQGIVFGIILVQSSQKNILANRLLAALLFLLSYRLIVQSLRLFGLGYYDTWYYFMLDLNWANGPLLYFYVKALIRPEFGFRQKDVLHFIPVLIQIGFSIFVRLQNLYWDGTRESLSWAGYWGYVVWMNYSTIYIVASILIIIYARKALFLLQAEIKGIQIQYERIQWIRKIVRSFLVYFLIVLAILIADLIVYNLSLGNSYFYFTRFYYYPFFTGISVLTYWVGIEGFKRKDEEGIQKQQVLSDTKQQQLEHLAKSLNLLMQKEQLYKNPTLSINELAEQLGVKGYLLSLCLKQIFQQKFSDYINELRVAEVQRLLKDPRKAHYTLLSLAMEAGFNSKSSFNRAVKKHLGILPSAMKN
ncbi:MAG: helix-turn-helix transcriptional regulator [Saprospiraceae bacterium]|nr:helix-turn-helix transcriptional regulator [Saprospiraceae bacterium]